MNLHVLPLAIISCLAFGGSLYWKFGLSNYEFRNRTGANVILFPSIIGSWLHGLSKPMSTIVMLLSGILALTAVFGVFHPGH